MEELPEKVLKSINLMTGEKVLLWLKGTFKEWLVCTDKQVFIVKKGFMTGHTFGNGVFQMPYKNIAGATVNFHLMSGYFELSAGGMQNTSKSYWSNKKGENPQQAPNCISITSKKLAEQFKGACGFIMDKIQDQSQAGQVQNNPVNVTAESIPDQIKKLAELKDAGILTEEEFSTKKSELLAKM